MSRYKWQIWIVLGLIAVSAFVGWYFGRKSVKVVTKTEYIKGETIHDSIPVPEPYEVLVPTKVDSLGLFKYLLQCGKYEYLIPHYEHNTVTYKDVDTMAIVMEFLTKNSYDITLFDSDTLGTLKVYPSVQYNRLITPLNYSFTPIHRVDKITLERKYEPYIGIGAGWNKSIIGELGIYHPSGFGFGFEYERYIEDKRNDYKIKLLKKF